MSPRFLERYALPGLLALLPIGAAFSQSTSARPAISANDLVRAVVANEATGREGEDWEPGQKFSRAAKTRADEEKRYGAMRSIFQDASRCTHLHLCRPGRRPDQAELPA